MASTGFATDDGTRILQETVAIHEAERPVVDIELFYDVVATAALIQSHNYRSIALQFPDALLSDALQVQLLLKDALGGYDYTRMFVLGDTSYGSCCVDEVAAQHLKADCVVHYGRACLSPTSLLPVIYVFGNAPCAIVDVVNGLQSTITSLDDKSTFVVIYEPFYAYMANDMTMALQKAHENKKFVCSSMQTMYIPTEAVEDSGKTTIGGLTIPMASEQLFSESTTLIYIGKETSHLTNILLRCGETPCYSFNPVTKECRLEGASINRTLNKRYFMVQKAKEAQVIGILMGTLGVAKYLDVVNTMQSLISKCGRKSYTFVVGKINVPKLSNFAEIDLFVLVACPENTLFDSTEYFKPIITPYELSLALDDSLQWSAQYKSDFQDVLPTLENTCDTIEDIPMNDEPYFSLITGTYVQQSHLQSDSEDDQEEMESSTALISKQKNQLIAFKSEAAEFLAKREYKGLEPRIGESTPHAAILHNSNSNYISEASQRQLTPSKRCSYIMRSIIATLAHFFLFVSAKFLNLNFGIGGNFPIAYPTSNTSSISALTLKFSDATASIFALQFANFSLPPTDYLVLQSLTDPTFKSIQLLGSQYFGKFNAPIVPGQGVRIDIYTSLTSPSTFGFAITGYQNILEDVVRRKNGTTESLCGTDDSQDAACFRSNPKLFKSSNAIARIVIKRDKTLFGCTAWLHGCEGHLITNNHCIHDSIDAQNTQIEFLAQAGQCPPPNANAAQLCNRPLACRGQQYLGPVTFVYTNSALDYTVIKLDSSVVASYGFLTMRPTGPNIGEPAYIVTHPKAWGKRISYKDGQGQAVLQKAPVPNVKYNLDTQDMSSGSPVLSMIDNKVIALHHAGFVDCPNYGIRSNLIYADLKKNNLLPSYCGKS
ncbi:diphthamide biosynthesis protein [Thraustotheca clavata]|uniref:2-(3-amino-3-carboxypropyl)histidine synthase subunit 2 n=1 Tax=Thraustotheca clavata TaxID=74557 RepID=A0A1W0A645_9STRA|nr:diphthamide biosynthesis protein [Thraustotheca clavata]